MLALVPAASAAAHRDESPMVVASGLDNPRGLDVYISNHGAEAGAGEVLRFRF